MYKIILVNMPFGSLRLPSIGLTQIKSVLDERFEGQVEVEIRYLSHDFAHYMGIELYQDISGAMEHHNAGMGDWFFRQSAFPYSEDNTEDYFERYFPHHNAETQELKRAITEKREGLDDFLDGLIGKYGLAEADIVGFTSMFMQNVACFAMARKIKERRPKIITVLGGANCESPMGQEIVRNVEQIDYVCSGPGLKNFTAFVQACLNQDMNRCESIHGLFSKKNCRRQMPLTPANPHQPASVQAPVMLSRSMTTIATSNAAAPPATVSEPQATIRAYGDELDINAGVKLEYDQFLTDLNASFPNKEIEPTLLFETSRGCWWGEKAHCTFCGLNGASMNYRAMSAEKALRLFQDLFGYADRCTRYNCVDNIMAKNYLDEVFPHLETPAHVHMFYEVKADLSEEHLRTLSKARVKIIQPGIESLATSTLKLMRKGTSAFQNLLLLRNCLLHDICPEWNLLIGFPGEGEDVYQKYVADLPLLMHLPPPSGVFPVRFDRYSPYYVKAKEYELDLHPVDFYELIYPFSQDSLANMAYYFTDRNYRAKYFLTMLKWLGKVREKFEVWSKLWNDPDADYPKLFLKQKGDATVVHDTRSGKLVEHPVSEAGVEVLKVFSAPGRISTVAAKLGHIAGFNAEREVALLQEKGLLFQEHDRFLSLVLPHDLPRMSFIPS